MKAVQSFHVDIRACVRVGHDASEWFPVNVEWRQGCVIDVNPFLQYGIKVWHGTYANIANKIFILEKKACRAIHNLPFNTHTTECFKNAKKLELTDLYESQISANILPKHSDIHNYPTRNNNKFIAPKCNMRKSEISTNFKSIKVWNKLPVDIRTSDIRTYLWIIWGTTSFHDTELITDVFLFSAICNISV